MRTKRKTNEYSLNMKLTAESIGSLDLLLAACLLFAVTSDTTENGDQAWNNRRQMQKKLA